MCRSSREVAIQSIIFGALGFRASLEVTVHPRSESLCSQLLPWLEELDFGDRIEEYHREILETPHRELPRESQAEAYWKGEAASFLGWAIQLCDKPDLVQPVYPEMLIDCLRILQPNAKDLVSSAIVRSEQEIVDYCTFCLSVRHHFQLPSLDSDGQIVLQRIHQAKLFNFGLNNDLDRQREIESDAAELASSVPHARGLYVVRAFAAEWLLGEEL